MEQLMMHFPENMWNCMQHSIYCMCNSRMWIWRGQWWKRTRQCMRLCRSMFSDQRKTHACLRVWEALSVSVCGEGEGACDNCMYVCVCMCREARAVRRVGGGWPDGDCRANWETGHCLAIISIPLTRVCLSISPAWGLNGFICRFHSLRRILNTPEHRFYRHEGRTDKSRQNR